jgi:hypothetical protein
MKILSTSITNHNTLNAAKAIAHNNARKGYAPYALVVFTSATAAHVAYYDSNEIGMRAKAAALLRVPFAVVEM